MKFTCLSSGVIGGGYNSPACHILELCGHSLLLECPLDLSAIAAFSPLPSASPAAASAAPGLIRAVPWYKVPGSLRLWDPALIDAVLISTPAAILGLPFLTRHPKFSAKVYATEATVTIGRMMMEELVELHMEYVRFYGPDERPGFPDWMKWEELEKLPPAVREIVVGEDGEQLGSWLPLYSAEDVNDCLLKVQSLKYGEETCYNGTLVLKAFSSGLEIGSCNWMINGPRKRITYLTPSIFKSSHAMGFDYHSLEGNDLIIFSDFSSLNSTGDDGHNDGTMIHNEMDDKDNPLCNISSLRDYHNKKEDISKCLLSIDDTSEEKNKISYICSLLINFLKERRSILFPIGRLGIILLLFEQISQSLESLNLQVPIFMISTMADEMLAFTNAVPEWLCKQRQEKLFSGDPLFGHVELVKGKKLHLFPALTSSKLLLAWQEPCIVFSPHWTLRLGPVIQLLQRWHTDDKCLLILEEEVSELALLPFKTFEIKVLQCSFLSGIKRPKVQPLLETLNPKLVLFPEVLKSQIPLKSNSSISFLYYSENVTVHVPSSGSDFEACLSTDLVHQLRPRRLTEDNMAIARLKGQLLLSNGKYVLAPPKRPRKLSDKQLLLWGSFDPVDLLRALHEKGIGGSINRSQDVSDSDACSIHITVPEEAMIQTSAKQTIIFADNETMAALIYDVICSVCNGI